MGEFLRDDAANPTFDSELFGYLRLVPSWIAQDIMQAALDDDEIVILASDDDSDQDISLKLQHHKDQDEVEEILPGPGSFGGLVPGTAVFFNSQGIAVPTGLTTVNIYPKPTAIVQVRTDRHEHSKMPAPHNSSLDSQQTQQPSLENTGKKKNSLQASSRNSCQSCTPLSPSKRGSSWCSPPSPPSPATRASKKTHRRASRDSCSQEKPQEPSVCSLEETRCSSQSSLSTSSCSAQSSSRPRFSLIPSHGAWHSRVCGSRALPQYSGRCLQRARDFIRRSPLRSPPLRSRSPCTLDESDDVTVTTTFSPDSERARAVADAFSSDSDLTPPSEQLFGASPGDSDTVAGPGICSPRSLSIGSEEACPSLSSGPFGSPARQPIDVSLVARLVDTDHGYSMLDVADIVEVEADAPDADMVMDMVMTPDSLEGVKSGPGTRGDANSDAPHDSLIQDVSLLLYTHVRNAITTPMNALRISDIDGADGDATTVSVTQDGGRTVFTHVDGDVMSIPCSTHVHGGATIDAHADGTVSGRTTTAAHADGTLDCGSAITPSTYVVDGGTTTAAQTAGAHGGEVNSAIDGAAARVDDDALLRGNDATHAVDGALVSGGGAYGGAATRWPRLDGDAVCSCDAPTEVDGVTAPVGCDAILVDSDSTGDVTHGGVVAYDGVAAHDGDAVHDNTAARVGDTIHFGDGGTSPPRVLQEVDQVDPEGIPVNGWNIAPMHPCFSPNQWRSSLSGHDVVDGEGPPIFATTCLSMDLSHKYTPRAVEPVAPEEGMSPQVEQDRSGHAVNKQQVSAQDGLESGSQAQEALVDPEPLEEGSSVEEIQGPSSSTSMDFFDNDEVSVSLSSSPDPLPASQAAFLAMSARREVPNTNDTSTSLGDISDIDSDGDSMSEAQSRKSVSRYFLHSGFENLETLASLAEMQEYEKDSFGLPDIIQYQDYNTSLDAHKETTPSKLVGKMDSWIVDIEAETLQRFPYYETDFEENPPDTLLQDDSVTCKKDHEERDHVELEGEAQISYDLPSTSTSPNRDLDALHLTQSAPLKRRASSKSLEQLNVKRSRRNWEEWYEQFKTMVSTGEQKKIIQADLLLKYSNKGDVENAVQVDSDLEFLSPELTHDPELQTSCQKISGMKEDSNDDSSSSRVGCERVKVLKGLPHNVVASSNKDQLVPERNCSPNPKPNCSRISHPYQGNKSLFNWADVTPSLKSADEFSGETFYDQRENAPIEEPKLQLKAQKSVLRLGLSKRDRPKPLHQQKHIWWVLKQCTLQ